MAQDGTNTFKSLFFLDDSYASGAVVIPAIRGVSRIMKKDSAEGDLFYFSIVVADAVKPVSATFRDEQRAASIRGALLVSIEKYYEGKGLCR